MLDLEKMFTIANRDTRSDINEHLPTLLKYGRSVGHITELVYGAVVQLLLGGMPGR